MMNIETLKKIAIELGYEIDNTMTHAGKPELFVRKDSNTFELFEPENNFAQRDKIQGHWKINLTYSPRRRSWSANSLVYPYKDAIGKTITRAITNLMDEVMK